MSRYHINDKGNAGRCSAEEGNCPFGADAPHFDTKQEAQKHYEQSFNSSFDKPKPVKKTKIYRVGTLEAPEKYFDDLNSILQDMDKFKPEGRQGRHGGIFASPDLDSHSRWVLGNRWNKHEGALDSHEITVDANSVYVYSVEAYEKASAHQSIYGANSDKFKESAEEFWDSGMVLSDWQEWAKENKPERGTWEIIMPPESIISAKKMSNRSIIENSSGYDTSELNMVLEPNRARKGLIWRKSDLSTDEESIIENKAREQNGVDETFIADMQSIYKKNAYQVEDLHNSPVKSEIYSAIKRLKKKDGEDMKPISELSNEEVSAFFTKVSDYLKIVETVIKERKNSI